MLVDFVVVSKRVGATGYIAAAVKICFASKTVDNCIIKTGRVNDRLVRSRRIIFSKMMNIVGDTILAVFMNYEIYRALYQDIHNVVFGQNIKHKTKNYHRYGPPRKQEGI